MNLFRKKKLPGIPYDPAVQVHGVCLHFGSL